MHRVWFGAAAAALLVAQGPGAQEAVAQDAVAQDTEGYYDAAEAFPVEPLTAEQEARLPAARRVVELAMPEGAYAEAMGLSFGASTAYAGEVEPDAFSALYSALAYASGIGEIASAKAEQAMAILDPAWRERQQAEFDHQASYGRAMMARFEPIMRQTMAELYAIYFSESELADIEAFFRTDSGAVYAQRSLTMTSDPRMSAAFLQQPDIWEGAYAGDDASLEAALAALPAARTFEELSPRDRARLAALTGLSEAELEEAMRQAVEMNTAAEAAADAAMEAAH